jgi:membrane-bound lytic murein transglycosylase B
VASTLRLSAFVLVWVLPVMVWADYSQRKDVQTYIAQLVMQHGFDTNRLQRLLGAARRKKNILEAIARPAERHKSWHEYRDLFVSRARIEDGIDFWSENSAALDRAAERFGVPPEIIVAIIGVETWYGRRTGSFRVVDALTTLAFDYPPRAQFFLGELTEFLLLAREENKDPLLLKGSYAGAMGYGQFIPSSFRAYAIDFDGDGTRDIWDSTTDAIGSVGNYFARHGWRGDAPVALRVEVADTRAEKIMNESLELKHDVAALVQLGVKMPIPKDDRLRDDTKVALFRMMGDKGPEYWIGLHDFYVITRYNHSSMYALAVFQLGQAIRQRAGRLALARG